MRVRNRLAQTTNFKTALRVYGHLAKSKRPEKTAIFYGKRGLGKTTVLEHLRSEYNGVYLYCMPNYSNRGFVDDLLLAAGLVPEHNSSASKVIKTFAQYLNDTERPLLLDNCDDIVTGKLPSIVRSIQDLSHMPVIMVGMERLKIKLSRCPELLDRAHIEQFRDISRQEVDALALALSGIEMDKELLDDVYRCCKGRVRRAAGSIELIDEFATRAGKKRITRADWGEQSLVVSGDPDE